MFKNSSEFEAKQENDKMHFHGGSFIACFPHTICGRGKRKVDRCSTKHALQYRYVCHPKQTTATLQNGQYDPFFRAMAWSRSGN
jgi:hypothetical protein